MSKTQNLNKIFEDWSTRKLKITSIIFNAIAIILFAITLIASLQAIEKTDQYNERLEEKGCVEGIKLTANHTVNDVQPATNDTMKDLQDFKGDSSG